MKKSERFYFRIKEITNLENLFSKEKFKNINFINYG